MVCRRKEETFHFPGHRFQWGVAGSLTQHAVSHGPIWTGRKKKFIELLSLPCILVYCLYLRVTHVMFWRTVMGNVPDKCSHLVCFGSPWQLSFCLAHLYFPSLPSSVSSAAPRLCHYGGNSLVRCKGCERKREREGETERESEVSVRKRNWNC